jgi:hypothetical protein
MCFRSEGEGLTIEFLSRIENEQELRAALSALTKCLACPWKDIETGPPSESGYCFHHQVEFRNFLVHVAGEHGLIDVGVTPGEILVNRELGVDSNVTVDQLLESSGDGGIQPDPSRGIQ